jgi:hypothetical protein
MVKRDVLVKFIISSPIKFSDAEDLEQQIEDLKVELESLGFEVDTTKLQHDDCDKEIDEYGEEEHDEDI